MTNISSDFELVEEEIDNHLEEIIFMLFFILSAMHLDLGSLTAMPLVIVAYILFRFLGKVSGVWVGQDSPRQIKKQKIIWVLDLSLRLVLL